MHNPEYHPYELSVDTNEIDLRTKIEEIAEGIYRDTAYRFDTDQNTVHRDRFCGLIEPLLAKAILQNGIAYTERVVSFINGGAHRYGETLDGRIWDGTWQQFLPPDKLSPDLPKVLSGTQEEIRSYLEQLGVQDQIGIIWSGQIEVELPEEDDQDWGWRGSEPRDENLSPPDVIVDDGMIEAIKKIRDTM